MRTATLLLALLSLIWTGPGCDSGGGSGADSQDAATADTLLDLGAPETSTPHDTALDLDFSDTVSDSLIDSGSDAPPDLSADAGQDLNDTSVDLVDVSPDTGTDVCVPNCSDKGCGDDGCGGTCGECELDEVCEAGACICVAECDGKMCGDDGCGGTCGECTGAQDQCVDGECLCQAACVGLTCGDDGCGGTCGVCESSGMGLPGDEECIDGICTCIPACQFSACGDDGCGGSCGECLEGMHCSESIQGTHCVCDMSCLGEPPVTQPELCCSDGQTCCPDDIDPIGGPCSAGACCWPGCDDKECGVGGCGEDCGTCDGNDECVANTCVPCAPDCEGKSCGEGDGCGGTCLDGGVLFVDAGADANAANGCEATPFVTIQAALAVAVPATEILVANGSYPGGVVVDVSGISIFAPGGGAVLSTGGADYGLWLQADDVSVQGVAAVGFAVGIGACSLEGGVLDGVSIVGVEVSGAQWGIRVRQVTGITISDAWVHALEGSTWGPSGICDSPSPSPDPTIGIQVVNSSGVVIDGNEVSNTTGSEGWDGMCGEFQMWPGSGGNALGIQCSGCSEATITWNNVNGVTGGEGGQGDLEYYGDGSKCEISGEPGGDAIGISFSGTGCSIAGNSVTGITGGDGGGGAPSSGADGIGTDLEGLAACECVPSCGDATCVADGCGGLCPGECTLYVDAAATGEPEQDGSEEHPYEAIQPALDAAAAGDHVQVASGVYPAELIVATPDLTITGVGAPAIIGTEDVKDWGVWIQASGVELGGIGIEDVLQGISVCAPGGAPVDGVELADVVISAVDRVGIWGMATEGLVLSAVEVTEVVASGEPLDAAAMTCGPLDTVDAFGVLLHGCIGVLLEGVVVGEVDGGSGSPGICTAVKEIDGTDGGDAVGIKLQGCDGFSMSQCEVQGLSGGDGGDGAYDWSPGPGGSWYTTCDGGDGGDAIGFLSTGGACSASDWTATGLSPGVGGGFPWGTGPCSGFSCPQPGVDGQGLVSLGLDGCT